MAHGSYPLDNERFSVFPSRRSVVHGTTAIVSTTSPLATQAGLRILREGGNAADAAIAAAAVLNLVDPPMTGIGGDAFALYYEAKTKQVHAVNGSGPSAAEATLDGICNDLGITDRITGSIPATSGHAVTVPGAAAAWVDIASEFGSGRLSLAQIMAPAIELAEEGFAVSELSSYYWVTAEAELRRRPNGLELLKPDPNAPEGARAPRPGEFYRNPLLAKTFRLLAEQGRRGFYEGPVAEAIVQVTRSLGGCLTMEDLRQHGVRGSEFAEPVALHIDQGMMARNHPPQSRHIHLWEHPPNGQGIVASMALGILQELYKQGRIPKFQPEDHNSAQYLHALVQALRIAFADGCWYITDPHSSEVKPQDLLSTEYLAERAGLFDPFKATEIIEHGWVHKTSDTIYLAVTDVEGNACSFVNSVADAFGSRIVPKGTGFVLQSRGAGFHLDPTHPNAFAAGKRPYNTIIPAMVTDAEDGSLHTVFGVMGGAMQPQGHVQLLLNMLTFDMNPQVALDAPRICIGVSLPGKSTDPSKAVDSVVYLEDGISEEVAEELTRLGHDVKYVTGMGRSLFGRGQIIRAHLDPVDHHRIYSAGSDMRGDGMSAPLV